MPQDLYKLPNGWEWRQLIAEAPMSRSSVTPANGDSYHYIGLEHIQSGTGNLIDFSPVDGSQIASSKTRFSKSMVLYGKLRPYLNKVHVAQFDGVSTTEIIPFDCSEHLLPEFLAQYLRSGHFLNEAVSNCSGTRMPRVTTKFLKETKIPLPPISEQERIVEKLDAIFRRIDAAAKRLNQILTHSQALFASALDQVFSSNDWKSKPLKELCAFENGDRGKNYPSRAAFVDEGIPVINAGALTEHGIDKHALNYITRERFDLLGGGKVRPGDILFCLRGSLGKSSIVEDIQEGAIASSLVIVRPSAELLEREFLQYYFRSSTCERFIHQYDNGAAQPNLSSRSLQKFELPLPPLEEQRRIVEHLDGLSERIQGLEKTTRDRLDHLADLKASLLDAAFRGEL